MLQVRHAFRAANNSNRAWYALTPTNPIRKACVRVTAGQWFGPAVMTLVLANCASMAIDDPTCDKACQQHNRLQRVRMRAQAQARSTTARMRAWRPPYAATASSACRTVRWHAASMCMCMHTP